METIKKLLNEIRAVDRNEIRRRLVEIDLEAKELRKVLRLASCQPATKEATRCK
jgi:hypothetical protein